MPPPHSPSESQAPPFVRVGSGDPPGSAVPLLFFLIAVSWWSAPTHDNRSATVSPSDSPAPNPSPRRSCCSRRLGAAAGVLMFPWAYAVYRLGTLWHTARITLRLVRAPALPGFVLGALEAPARAGTLGGIKGAADRLRRIGADAVAVLPVSRSKNHRRQMGQCGSDSRRLPGQRTAVERREDGELFLHRRRSPNGPGLSGPTVGTAGPTSPAPLRLPARSALVRHRAVGVNLVAPLLDVGRRRAGTHRAAP